VSTVQVGRDALLDVFGSVDGEDEPAAVKLVNGVLFRDRGSGWAAEMSVERQITSRTWYEDKVAV